MKLKQVLFDEYAGFADKRIKRLDRGSLFIVDDRGPGDSGADKKLFLWFCLIFADVLSETEVRIQLRGGLPKGPSVDSWIAANKKVLGVKLNGDLTFKIKKGQEQNLLELANAIAQLVAAGKKYTERAYKYVCPRTAHSLKKLAATLDRAWAPNESS
jgi:hypothetical protein